MKKDSVDFLQKLLRAPSVSGYEFAAARIFRKRVERAADKLLHDVSGNSIAILNPDAPFRFMLAGHIDEIGLVVTHIDDKGFLSVAPVGGLHPAVLVGQRVHVLSGEEPVLGVIGRRPEHDKSQERDGKISFDQIQIDLGVANRDEAKELVSVGDAVVVDAEPMLLRGDRLIGRGCDDKAGAFIVAEVIRALAKRKLEICVIGVATVQEEVGHRGAITSAFEHRPDAGIAVDVNFASDIPGSDPKKGGEVLLGAGPNLHRGPNINPVLQQCLVETARDIDIPVQITAEARPTGTDANHMQISRSGVATAIVSIPNRYMHSPVEMIDLNDMDRIIQLLVEFLARHPAERDYRP